MPPCAPGGRPAHWPSGLSPSFHRSAIILSWHATNLPQRVHVQRADAFNVFNHTQFTGVHSTLTYASCTNLTPTNLYLSSNGSVNVNGFGALNGVRDPRIRQLVMRLQF